MEKRKAFAIEAHTPKRLKVSPSNVSSTSARKDGTPEERAKALGRRMREDNPLTKGWGRSSHEVGAEKFVDTFFKASRLHFIGTWKERYEKLLISMPPLPRLKHQKEKRWFFHVDMDAFFASVTTRGNKELQQLPVVICWGSEKSGSGEISCANYVARRAGVRAGEWLSKAKEKCPTIVSLPFEFEKYTNTAIEMYKCLFRLTPQVLGLSCDEAYLEVSSVIHEASLFQPGVDLAEIAKEVAEELRQNIFKYTQGCTASVGIGSNRFLARLATAKAKPNGVFHLSDEESQNTIGALKVSDIPSVGYSTSKCLHNLGIQTGEDLRNTPKKVLIQQFGPQKAQKLFEYARGIDEREWDPNPVRKSISAQISWGVRMKSNAEVEEFISCLSSSVVERMLTVCDRDKGKSKRRFAGALSVGLKLWRAKPNANPNKRKGSLGHGQCTMLNRTYLRSVATKNPQVVAKDVWMLYKGLKIQPEEVRGMGIILGKFQKTSGLQQMELRSMATKKTASKEILSKNPEPCFDLANALKNSNLYNDVSNVALISHGAMVDQVLKEVRKAKIEPELLPFLSKNVLCSDSAFCDGDRCGSFRCFQISMLDSAGQLLYEFCQLLESNNDFERAKNLIQAVKEIATCMWEKDSHISIVWRSICDQLKFRYREDMNSSQISYSSQTQLVDND